MWMESRRRPEMSVERTPELCMGWSIGICPAQTDRRVKQLMSSPELRRQQMGPMSTNGKGPKDVGSGGRHL